ncbi:F-box protein PP2-A13-like [Panicum miliaceum]|uniref:F-box protein PP2-A13-like n=1 Tax=Panicum miliaceum TaxID=4540 RepID=A0A3L6THZ2_PANMI|nr:F-box protein PP2-A13-like [Panicum miliaceum]
MGAGALDLAGMEPGGKVARAGLGDLPELCAAEVLLYLDAPDICRLSRLNRAFRGAAAADFVWDAKLPENYGHLLRFVDEAKEVGSRSEMGEKDIFARLAKPVPFDGGRTQCSVYMLYGTYSLYFRLHLGKSSTRYGRRICSSEQIHGWDKKPVRFQLSTSDGQHAASQCYLDEPGSWILYHVGDFVASSSEQPLKLKFSLAQIDCTRTKGGLCVDSVLIYPKVFEPERVIKAQK